MDSSRLPGAVNAAICPFDLGADGLPTVEAIQPKIRAQLAEAMTRQYQMTALQHQTGSKPGEKPISSPILQIRGAFSVPSPGPSGRRSAVPESKLAASPKQSRKYEPEPPRDKALGPESLGVLPRPWRVKTRRLSLLFSRICRLLSTETDAGRRSANRGSHPPRLR